MRRLLAILAWTLCLSVPLEAQTILSTTVLQSDIGPTTGQAIFAHGDALTVAQVVFIFDDSPEAMLVTAITGDRVSLTRGFGTPASAHRIGALAFYGASSSFGTVTQTPGATCPGTSVIPTVNLQTRKVYQCVASAWVESTPSMAVPSGYGRVVQATSATLITPTISGGTITRTGYVTQINTRAKVGATAGWVVGAAHHPPHA